MKVTIALNANTPIDLAKLIESRMVIQANSGGGKSWVTRKLIEEAFGHTQIIVIDPEGEFGNMRGEYDFVYAGKDGDAPVESRSAALLATRLLELKASAIVDLYELPPQERKHFVRLFLDSMVNAPKELWPINYGGCLVFLDEADLFAPEKRESEALSAVIDMAGRGRKRGYCLIPATRRPAQLNKDVAAECNNKLIGRASLDIDRKRSAEELGFTTKEQVLSLRHLEPGEFYTFGPAISREVVKTVIGDVKVKPPKPGMGMKAPPPPTAKVRAILSKLADLPAEAAVEARTSAELKTEVAKLKRELTLAKRDAPSTAPVKIERIEIPIVGKRALEGLKASEINLKKLAKAIHESAGLIDTVVAKLSGELAKVQAPPSKGNTGPIVGIPVAKDHIARAFPPKYTQSASPDGEARLSGPEQRIVDAIAWMESIGVMEPEQTAVTFLAGYTYGGGGFNNPRGSLRTKGLVEYRGNNIALTDTGRGHAKPPDSALTSEELHKKVLDRLPGPERKLLMVLLERNGDEISNEELAERSGYTFGSGGFNNPRGRLRSLGLIEYVSGGKVKARSLLFLE